MATHELWTSMQFSKISGTIYIRSHCFAGEILVSNWLNELSSRQTIKAKYTASTDSESNKHGQDEHPTKAVCLAVVRSRHLDLSAVWAARGWGSVWAVGSRVYPNLHSVHLGKVWRARQVCNNLGLLFGCYISAAGTLTTQSRVTLGVSAKVVIWHMPLSTLPPQVIKFTELSGAWWDIYSLVARFSPCVAAMISQIPKEEKPHQGRKWKVFTDQESWDQVQESV